MIYRLLADLIVVVHFSYVAFVIVGQLAILIGWALKWGWIRSPVFRSLHVLAIAIVVAETLCGVECPLTTWEHSLRQLAGQASDQGGFIAGWVHKAMFYDGPSWVFTLGYSLFGLLVLTTFVLVPPKRPVRRVPVSKSD